MDIQGMVFDLCYARDVGAGKGLGLELANPRLMLLLTDNNNLEVIAMIKEKPPGLRNEILPGFEVEHPDLVIPKEDTHPGPGLSHLDGKVEEPDPHDMLGE